MLKDSWSIPVYFPTKNCNTDIWTKSKFFSVDRFSPQPFPEWIYPLKILRDKNVIQNNIAELRSMLAVSIEYSPGAIQKFRLTAEKADTAAI